MKKLMLVLGVMAIAMCSQAAAFKWTAAQMYDSTGASLWAGEVKLFAGDVLVDTATAASGSVVNKTFTWADAVASQEYSFTVVIEDSGKVFTSHAVNAVAQASATSPIGFNSLKTETQTAGNWQAAPEPTSGLMLLLGVGLMALKRKRA